MYKDSPLYLTVEFSLLCMGTMHNILLVRKKKITSTDLKKKKKSLVQQH